MKLYKAQKPVLEKKLGEQGMMLLYAVPWPPQGIYVKKPINSAADLKGVKWRAYSPATARIAELVGAQPVTVQAAELSQAMATGVVESYMSSGSTGYDTKTYEHIKYWYDTQAWLPKNAVLVNKAAFDALDKPTQAAVLKAGADAETRGWELSKEKNTEYIELLKKNGMTIVAPPPQLKADMKKVGDDDAEGVAREGRRRRAGDRRRLQEDVMARRAEARTTACAARSTRSTTAPPALAALFMVLLLVMVLLSIVGAPARLQHSRHRRLRRLHDGRGRLPRARPHAEARRAHPRDAAARRR